MNTYLCLDCGKIHTEACTCGSSRQQHVGDIHLATKGLNAYVSVETRAGEPHLVVKKPSGQVDIRLAPEDLLPPPKKEQPRRGSTPDGATSTTAETAMDDKIVSETAQKHNSQPEAKKPEELSCSEWIARFGRPCGGYRVGCRYCPAA